MDKVNYYVATKEGNVVGFTGLYTLIDQPATAKAQTTSALRCQQFVARLRLERHRVDSTSGFAATILPIRESISLWPLGRPS
jgi:hypothetical protein